MNKALDVLKWSAYTGIIGAILGLWMMLDGWGNF